MAFQDPMALREKIIRFLKNNGPSLPVHISKETGLSILFSSAFLSELLAEKEIKMSNLRVGSSPVYFIQGQEPLLERFSQHLKSKEKEAFLLLREKRFLKDNEQSSAIRVALREIKDYGIPTQGNGEIVWRYFTVSEDEISRILEAMKNPDMLGKNREIITELAQEEKEIEKTEKEPEESEKEIELMEVIGAIAPEQAEEEKEAEETAKPKDKKEKLRKKEKRKLPKKKNEQFFNRVKEFISQESLEILDIESFDKDELVLKVKNGKKEFLVIAFNKKRIVEEDIISAYKKASERGLKYEILSLGEPAKKIDSLITALKELEKIEVIK
jgi:hypothetical protein